MTEMEFKIKAIPIFAAGPKGDNLKKIEGLLEEARKTIPLNRLAIVCAEALDAAYPTVSAIGLPSAVERMQKIIDERGVN